MAKQTAAAASLPHRIIHQKSTGFAEIDQLAYYFDEPFGDCSAVPTFELCRAASEHATVFLSGDGGDEAFAGYRRYIETQRYKNLARLVRPLRSAIAVGAAGLSHASKLRYRLSKLAVADDGYAAGFDSPPSDPMLTALAGEKLIDCMPTAGRALWSRWRRSRTRGLLVRQQQLDFSLYLPDDILVKMDRASMAHSIEVRSPFLDYRVVEWAARLPRPVLLNRREGKRPLRRLASELLPGIVSTADKRGFGAPVDAWFREARGQAFANERLLSREARERGWWSGDEVRHMLDAHARGTGRQFGVLIWRLLMLDAWARVYVDSPRRLDSLISLGQSERVRA